MNNYREIIFRGFCKDTGEWVEGLYSITGDGSTNIDVINSLGLYEDSFTVYPASVGEYTGVRDANGRRIFEGDLIKGKGKEVFQVVYQPSISSFMAVEHGDFECRWIPSLNYGTMKSYEVIGNVHDEQKQMEITL